MGRDDHGDHDADPAAMPMDASLSAAADAGRSRGTLAKMIAVRTVVAITNPAPMSRNGWMKYG